MEVPLTPKSDYTSVQDEPRRKSFDRANLPSNVPILDTSQYALERDSELSSRSLPDGRPTDVSDPDTRSSRMRYPILPSPLRRFLRWWMALRWRMSRSIFSVTLPYVTAEIGLKLGDLLVTLPVILILIVITSLQAQQREVKASGTPPSIAMIVVFGLAVRNNSVLLVLTNIPFERALFYHKLFAFVTIILTALHGLAYVLNNRDIGVTIHEDEMTTGMVAFIGMVAMYILSLSFIRRSFFEFFVRTHWVLFIVVIVFTVMHGAGLVLIGVVPWGIDMLFRLAYRTRIYAKGALFKGKRTQDESVITSSNVIAPNTSRRMGVVARDMLSVTPLPGNITRIQFPRTRQDTGEEFAYEPGQYVFLCIPQISMLEWHPITISSAPHEAMVTFHVKAVGSWTNRLLAAAAEAHPMDMRAPFDVLVDGPYGSISVDIDSAKTYSHFVLFSGGIGVTPMRSIVNWLHYECHYHGRGGMPRVRFVWSVRDRAMVDAMLKQDLAAWDNCREMDEVAPYVPHILLHPRSTNDPTSDFFSEIYLTQGHPDVEADPDQGYSKCLRYGRRPDTARILREMGEDAKKHRKKRVAVLVCGPSAMVKDIINASQALSREMQLHFDVHSEMFAF